MRPLSPRDPARVGGYRLLGRLGEGGMGMVYLGRSDGGALVALKVIHEEYAHEPAFRARFAREVAAARRVDSPYVATVPAADTESRALWLATAYVPGPSLAEAVGEHGPLPPDAVRALGAMLAEALAAVHEAGLVHRDVKPANVLLTLDGPRLIDFGIARTLDASTLTLTGVVVGSPGYFSPEQASGDRDIGPSSDVFSLGCVLAYAATGRSPFAVGPEEDIGAVLYRTVHDSPDLGAVPGELKNLVAACLAKDPARRPGTAELRRELAPTGGTDAGDHAVAQGAKTLETDADADAGWLPPAVTRMVAQRYAAQADLPDIPPTGALGSDGSAETPDADGGAPDGGDGPSRPSRRRLLSLTAAGAVAAGGGLGAWSWLRSSGGESGAEHPAPGRPRHVIGLQADLSGEAAALGRAQERGAVLAVEEVAGDPDLPFDLEIRVRDDRGDRDRATRVAQEFADDPDVLAVIGPTTDTTAFAAVQVCESAGLPMLTVSVATILHTMDSAGTTVALHARQVASMDGATIALWANHELRPRVIGLVDDRHEDLSYLLTRSVSSVLDRTRTDLVPRVLPQLTSPYAAIAREFTERGVDLVVYGGGARRGGELARALHRVGYDGRRLAGEPAMGEEFLERAGEAAEGWEFLTGYIDPAAEPRARDFLTAFRERFGAAPRPYAAESYDVAHLVARTLRRLHADTRGTPERAALLERLRGADYRGVGKRLRFGEEGYYLAEEVNGLHSFRVADGRFRFQGAFWYG